MCKRERSTRTEKIKRVVEGNSHDRTIRAKTHKIRARHYEFNTRRDKIIKGQNK